MTSFENFVEVTPLVLAKFVEMMKKLIELEVDLNSIYRFDDNYYGTLKISRLLY
jgi:hypothetical protein